MSTVALWHADQTVALTGHRRHLHKGPAVAPAFIEPALASQIQFGPTALAASIARTATLRAAPPELLAHIRDSTLSEAQILLADGPSFTLSPLLRDLADSERTHFASRVGAGITDLYMNALGYTWRDNAACLSSSLKPHADFLYYGGNSASHGVVLAEARGSFAAKVSDSKVARMAEEKYLRQVRPHVGQYSPHGQVVHGYSIAFGAKPDMPGAYLRLSQTRRPKTKPTAKPGTPKPSSTSPVATPAGMALATHRSNFILMGAQPVVDWIDWLVSNREIPDGEPVTFVQFEYAERSFLSSTEAMAAFGGPFLRFKTPEEHNLFWVRWDGYWPEHLRSRGLFAIEEKAATVFLGALSGMIRSGPQARPTALELPIGDIAGFSENRKDVGDRRSEDAYDYALFRDGLALVADPRRSKLLGLRHWHPKEGFM